MRPIYPVCAALLAAAVMFGAGEPAPITSSRAQVKPSVPRVDLSDAEALIRLIRQRATAGSPPSADQLPPDLSEARNLPLLVTLYRSGPVGFRHAAARPTLKESAEEAGARLATFLRRMPTGKEVLDQGVLHIDVAVSREPVRVENRYLLADALSPGLDGLACTDGGRTVYFSPLLILRHWRQLDLLRAIYIAQESTTPPAGLRLERVSMASFVERDPGGEVLRVYRGNLLLPDPHAEEMLRAVSHAGLWLLRTQQADGSFLPTYHPASQESEKEPDLIGHLRATVTLALLQQLTGDARFAEAHRRAVRYAMGSLREEKRAGFVYLPVESDEVSPSALLLTALCAQAVSEPNPSASGLMKYLGEFLCTMTAPSGRLYAVVSNALEERPPYVVQGQPYAEALLALCLLQHISPSPRVRETIERLVGFMTTFRPDAPPAGPRTIEALAAYYRLRRVQRMGEVAMDLGRTLAGQQISDDKAAFEDYRSGFQQPDLPPDTYTTALALNGMAAAYETGILLGQPVKEFSAPVRKAARFLMNLQNRRENTYYLRHPEVVLGAFRKSPEDLTLRLADVAEATRALVSAATVVAETVPPEPLTEGPAQAPR